MKPFIYADHAATTAVKPQVFEAMLPYFSEQYGNPSSIHAAGRAAKRAMETAREQCATALGATVREIYFTGGGTEADNFAILGMEQTLRAKSKTHVITSAIEHHAVLHPMEELRRRGFSVTVLPVDENGCCAPETVARALRPETGLVSIMAANNEIGTIEPFAAIGAFCREHGVLFHTDAVQAFGQVPIDVQTDCIDLLSVSGHKLGGPKGVGFLYAREGIRPTPLLLGGGQERNLRPGTEAVASLVGLGAAAKLAVETLSTRTEAVTRLRDRLIAGVRQALPDVRLNGSADHRLCGNANFTIPGVQGESLLLLLDLQGICASAGSACTTGQVEASHVLRAIGLSEPLAQGSIRFSLDEDNTEEEVDTIVRVLTEQVQKLRAMCGYV